MIILKSLHLEKQALDSMMVEEISLKTSVPPPTPTSKALAAQAVHQAI